MTDTAEFLAAFARERAERVVETPGGFAVLSTERFPHAHDHNALYVQAATDPDHQPAAADRVLAPLEHRRLEITAGALTAELAAALTAAGYEPEDLVVMTYAREPDADRPTPAGVVELTVPQRVAAADAVWAEAAPHLPAAVRRELSERAHTAVTAARCTFLGVTDEGGTTVASADLFVRGDTAQVEEVGTRQRFRGRGHASRLVRAAVEYARRDAPGRTVFLVADADDWPRRLYARLGFDVTATRTVWTRLSPP